MLNYSLKTNFEYQKFGEANLSLKNYFAQDKYLNFDLGRIETWPGFDELSDADQAFYKENFSLDSLYQNGVGSQGVPTSAQMPFISLIGKQSNSTFVVKFGNIRNSDHAP